MKFRHCANTPKLVKQFQQNWRTLEKTFASQNDRKTFVIRLAASHHRKLTRLL